MSSQDGLNAAGACMLANLTSRCSTLIPETAEMKPLWSWSETWNCPLNGQLWLRVVVDVITFSEQVPPLIRLKGIEVLTEEPRRISPSETE